MCTSLCIPEVGGEEGGDSINPPLNVGAELSRDILASPCIAEVGGEVCVDPIDRSAAVTLELFKDEFVSSCATETDEEGLVSSACPLLEISVDVGAGEEASPSLAGTGDGEHFDLISLVAACPSFSDVLQNISRIPCNSRTEA